MNLRNHNIDPVAYKQGWEKAQQEFELYLKAQYEVKTKLALEKLKRGEIFSQVIEAA